MIVIGSKVWKANRKIANEIIKTAKQKYINENVNAIVGVEKDRMLVLQKDVYDDTDGLVKAVANWEHGGYKCYYTTKKG